MKVTSEIFVHLCFLCFDIFMTYNLGKGKGTHSLRTEIYKSFRTYVTLIIYRLCHGDFFLIVGANIVAYSQPSTCLIYIHLGAGWS